VCLKRGRIPPYDFDKQSFREGGLNLYRVTSLGDLFEVKLGDSFTLKPEVNNTQGGSVCST